MHECQVTSLMPDSCNATDCSLPGSSVHGILQARLLECIAFPFSRGSSQPRDRTQVSRIAGGFFTSWATREAQIYNAVSWMEREEHRENMQMQMFLNGQMVSKWLNSF